VKKSGGDGHQTINGNLTGKVQIGDRSVAADHKIAPNHWIGFQQQRLQSTESGV
jgi:hypothetical protein